MGLLILLLFLAGAIVFFIQNQQPIALIFFGSSLGIQLPLAVWVFIFALLGALTIAIVHLLNRLSAQSAPQNLTSGKRKPGYSPLPPPEPQTPVYRQPERDPTGTLRDRVISDTTPVRKQALDWGDKGTGDDWNVEEPPSPPPVQEIVDRAPQEEKPPQFEVQQTPKSSEQQGSVYSYRYREAKEKIDNPAQTPPTSPKPTPNKTDSVYDANYRVITPPYQDNRDRSIQEDDNDEEWV